MPGTQHLLFAKQISTVSRPLKKENSKTDDISVIIRDVVGNIKTFICWYIHIYERGTPNSATVIHTDRQHDVITIICDLMIVAAAVLHSWILCFYSRFFTPGAYAFPLSVGAYQRKSGKSRLHSHWAVPVVGRHQSYDQSVATEEWVSEWVEQWVCDERLTTTNSQPWWQCDDRFPRIGGRTCVKT